MMKWHRLAKFTRHSLYIIILFFYCRCANLPPWPSSRHRHIEPQRIKHWKRARWDLVLARCIANVHIGQATRDFWCECPSTWLSSYATSATPKPVVGLSPTRKHQKNSDKSKHTYTKAGMRGKTCTLWNFPSTNNQKQCNDYSRCKFRFVFLLLFFSLRLPFPICDDEPHTHDGIIAFFLTNSR